MSQIYDTEFSVTKNLSITLYTALTFEQGENFSYFFFMKRFPRIAEFFNTLYLGLNMSRNTLTLCKALSMPPYVTLYTFFPKCFTFACTMFCAFVAHTSPLFLKEVFLVCVSHPVLCVFFFLGATCFQMLQ